MSTERRRTIIDTRPERDQVTEPLMPVAPHAPAASSGRRDVTFRGGRTAAAPSRRTGIPTSVLVAAVVLAIVSAAGTAWAFAGPHAAPTNSPATASSTVAAAKPAKKRAKRSASAKKTGHATAKTAAKRVSAPPVAKKSAPKHVAAATPKPAAKPVAPRTLASLGKNDVVVIDAGHQGHGDSSLEPIGPGSSTRKPKVADGAAGRFAPYDESAVNLAVALKLRSALSARGVEVVMIRTSQNVNIANSERAAIANKAHAALFIRLHCDDISNSSRHGFSTLIPATNRWTGPIVSASAKAGRLVQRDALAATGAADAGVVQRSDLSGFNWSKVPTVLVEMGFMSNTAEDKALTTPSYQRKLATGLANGVVDYLKSR